MKKRKIISFVLTVCMVLAMAPSPVFAGIGQPESTTQAAQTGQVPQTFADMNGHWAAEAVSKWTGLGIVKGDSGGFRPNDPITRAELAAILDNLMDYQVKGDNTFSDVNSSAWYAGAVLKANAAGILTGDGAGHALPNAKVTREQAAVMLARAFGVQESSAAATSFKDASSISNWAKALVFGMEADQYIGGTGGGNFEPKANITRAQVVTIIDNAVQAYYTAAGTYTDDVAPKTTGANCVAIVRTDNVIIKDAEIAGDLIVAEGVGNGNFTLDHSTVSGELIARGGGENSIHIINGADVHGRVSVEKINGIVRIVSDGVVIAELEADADIVLEGEFTNVAVAEGASVEVRGKVANLDITGKADIKAAESAAIGIVTVENGAQGTNLEINKKAVIGKLEAKADMTTSGGGAPGNVTGSGKVTDKETADSTAGTGSGGGGGGNSGKADKRSISLEDDFKTLTNVVEGTSPVYIYFDGTDSTGVECKGLKLGTISVQVDDAVLTTTAYSIYADNDAMELSGTYIKKLSAGKHNIIYKITASDGKVFTANGTLYLVPPTAGILFDQPEGCTVIVKDNNAGTTLTKGSTVNIKKNNYITVSISGLAAGKRIKSATVTNSYYDYTDISDITYDLITKGESEWIQPRGITTITIVTEDVPAELPKISAVEFYLDYDYGDDAYGQKVTEVPAMLPGDDSMLYAKLLYADGTACKYANYSWTLTSGSAVLWSDDDGSDGVYLYPEDADNDTVMTLHVTGYPKQSAGDITASITIKAPLKSQSQPTGLTAGAVSSLTAKDGKIIGTTTDMEYKMSMAEDSAYVTCGSDKTTGLALGTYSVRMKAKPGYAAGWSTEVDVWMNRAAPTGLVGSSPTGVYSYDAKITGTTEKMEWRSSTSSYYGGCPEGSLEVSFPGTYYVRYRAVDGTSYASADTVITILPYIMQDQAAPTGLTTEPTSHATSSDGKIKGTSADMEYKLSSASTYTGCSAGQTEWLVAGTYYVRLKAKTGYNASPDTTVVITAPAANNDANLQSLGYYFSEDNTTYSTQVPGFDPSVTTYNISLYGNQYGKTFDLNPYASDPGFATVTHSAVTGNYAVSLKADVTAEDGVTKKTYTVNITVERRTGEATINDNIYNISGDTEPVITMNLTDRDGEEWNLQDVFDSGGTLSIRNGSIAVYEDDPDANVIDPKYYAVDAANGTITIKSDFFSGKTSGTIIVFCIRVTVDSYTIKVQEVSAPYITVKD